MFNNMGTYFIQSVLNDVEGKFTCMVSFNGAPCHRHEVDSMDPKEIDMCLQATADRAEAKAVAKEAAVKSLDSIFVTDGKIVVPE